MASWSRRKILEVARKIDGKNNDGQVDIFAIADANDLEVIFSANSGVNKATNKVRITTKTDRDELTPRRVVIRPNHTNSEARFEIACKLAALELEKNKTKELVPDEVIDQIAAAVLVPTTKAPGGLGENVNAEYEIKARYNLPEYGLDALRDLWDKTRPEKATVPAPSSYPTLDTRLKVFLSADIVGSTALKQKYKAKIEDVIWPRIIRGFYRNFIDSIEHRWFHYRALTQEDGFPVADSKRLSDDKIEDLFGPSPKFWKTVGDEVLFWKELTSEKQIWMTLVVWLAAVADVRSFLKSFDEEDVNNLDIKSTCWIAEFPVRNRLFRAGHLALSQQANFFEEIYETPQVDRGLSYDFIGPALDIGFRIASLSTNKKMHIDVGTAYLMACSNRSLTKVERLGMARLIPDEIGLRPADPEARAEDRMQIFYSGSEILKGVGDIKYPMLWINTCDTETSEFMKERALWPDGRPRLKLANLKQYCETFYKERDQSLWRPFIYKKRRSDVRQDARRL